MRERVFRDANEYLNGHKHWYVNGAYSYNLDEPYVAERDFFALQDEVIPNFRKRSAQGEVFFNPMLSVMKRKTEVASQLYYNLNPNGHGAHYRLCSAVLPLPPSFSMSTTAMVFIEADAFLASLIDQSDFGTAVTRAWANVSVNEAAAWSSLGEFPETIRWAVSLMTRMIQITRFFKSKRERLKMMKRLSKADNLADSLSNLWLEYRYAVRPLVFDMHNCISAMHTQIEKGSRQTARGYVNVNTYDSDSGLLDQGLTSTMNYIYRVRTYLSYRAGVLYDIENDINGILALWGFDQPLEAIWDLTPFSHILDWFFNIGETIAGWSTNASLRALGSWVTVAYEQTGVAALTNFNINQHTLIKSPLTSFTPGSYQQSVIIKKRFPHPDRPIIPTFNLKLDTLKLIDLATIGRGLYRRLLS